MINYNPLDVLSDILFFHEVNYYKMSMLRFYKCLASIQIVVIIFGGLVMLTNCTASKYSYKVKGESLELNVKEDANLIKYATMKPQNAPKLASGDKDRGVEDIVGKVASAAVDGVILLVDKEKKKYTASYRYSVGENYFYEQISESSAFDPTGMKFTGFTFLRMATDNAGQTDTAVYAKFKVDEENAYEIINNSMFSLKLDELKVNYAKAKIMSKKWYEPLSWFMAPKYPVLNMDFEIIVTSSFVNRDGGIFDNVPIGKFYLTLRNIPLGKTDPVYEGFYANVKNNKVIGRSFLVPRSFGYYYDLERKIKPSYGQGMYNIVVNVSESSRSNFVSKMVFDNSTEIIKQAGGAAKLHSTK